MVARSRPSATRIVLVRCHPGTKTPIGDDWAAHASDDPDDHDAWLADGFNVGLLLGPRSGVIDVEADSDDGVAAAERMLGDCLMTPTYLSRRSAHRLYQYDPRFDGLRAVAKLDGVEFRLGSGGKSAHSLYPPSVADGVKREWLPGLSPDDVDIQRLPEDVIQRLLQSAGGNGYADCDAGDLLSVQRGDAHDARVSIAFALRREFRLGTPAVRDCLTAICREHFPADHDPVRRREHIDRLSQEVMRGDTRPHDLYSTPARDEIASLSIQLADAHQRIERLTAALSDDRGSEAIDDPGGLPESLINPGGLLGEIIDFTLSTAHRPRKEMALAGALSLMSTITGRVIETDTGLRSNLYVFGLAGSGGGKDHPRKINKTILGRIPIGDADKLAAYEDFSSVPGLIRLVRTRLTPLVQIDECHKLLAASGDRNAPAWLAKIPDALKDLYTSSNSTFGAAVKATTDGDGDDEPVACPHLTLFGTTTLSRFWGSFRPVHLSDGLFGRALIFEDSGYQRHLMRSQVAPPERLVSRIRGWIEFRRGLPGGNLSWESGDAVVWPFDDDAKGMMEAFTAECDDISCSSRDDVVSATWDRTWERAAKLSLICAASRGGPGCGTITADDCRWGIAVARHVVQRMLCRAGEHSYETEVERLRKRVLRELRRSKNQRMTRGQLTEKLAVPGKAVTAIASDLEESGMVTVARDVPRRGSLTISLR